MSLRRLALLAPLLWMGCNRTEPAQPAPREHVTIHQMPSPAPMKELVLPAPSDPSAKLQVPAEMTQQETAQEEPVPDAALEWLVEGEPAAGAKIRAAELLAAFDPGWRQHQKFARLFGWHGTKARLVTDPNETFDRAGVGVLLLTASGDDDLRMSSAEQLNGFLADVTPRLKRAGAARVSATTTAEEGVARSKELAELFQKNSTEVQLRLNAPDPTPFDGKKVLDVLLSLGMPSREPIELGGVEVKTHSPPGKLDAATLLDPRTHPNHLLFELRVPDAARPLDGYKLLLQAAHYAQKRLGGKLSVTVETFGRPVITDEKTARASIVRAAAALEKAGFPPGAPSTRRLFTVP